jgi:hypothetical protein
MPQVRIPEQPAEEAEEEAMTPEKLPVDYKALRELIPPPRPCRSIGCTLAHASDTVPVPRAAFYELLTLAEKLATATEALGIISAEGCEHSSDFHCGLCVSCIAREALAAIREGS